MRSRPTFWNQPLSPFDTPLSSCLVLGTARRTISRSGVLEKTGCKGNTRLHQAELFVTCRRDFAAPCRLILLDLNLPREAGARHLRHHHEPQRCGGIRHHQRGERRKNTAVGPPVRCGDTSSKGRYSPPRCSGGRAFSRSERKTPTVARTRTASVPDTISRLRYRLNNDWYCQPQ